MVLRHFEEGAGARINTLWSFYKLSVFWGAASYAAVFKLIADGGDCDQTYFQADEDTAADWAEKQIAPLLKNALFTILHMKAV